MNTIAKGERTRNPFMVMLFAFHLLAALGWWWIMPGGFALDHPRFWANCGIPAFVAFMSLVGLIAISKQRPHLAHLVAAMFPALWTSLAVVSLLLFPQSRTIAFLTVLAGSLLLWFRWFASLPSVRVAAWECLPTILLGTALGGLLPWTQRSADAATLPTNVAVPQRNGHREETRIAKLADNVCLNEDAGSLFIQCGLNIELLPLLTFVSRSPDRCWTSLATRSDRMGPSRALQSSERDGDDLRLWYRCDGDECLKIRSLPGNGTQVTTYCQLLEEVFSHLNSFNQLTVSGHTALELTFSPCPEVRIEATASDYPIGRPRRFAYLGPDGAFRVVEARSGEKGPFRELASGPLARSTPLVITFYDQGLPVCRVTLEDWASQCTTQLSPTAGWGVPVNAIEFERGDDRSASPVTIWMTLAATSIGRGWDSVGHCAGVYRNRVRVEKIGGGRKLVSREVTDADGLDRHQ